MPSAPSLCLRGEKPMKGKGPVQRKERRCMWGRCMWQVEGRGDSSGAGTQARWGNPTRRHLALACAVEATQAASVGPEAS